MARAMTEKYLVNRREICYNIVRSPCSVRREKKKFDPTHSDRESGFTIRSPALGKRGKWTDGGRIPSFSLSGSNSAFLSEGAGIFYFPLIVNVPVCRPPHSDVLAPRKSYSES